ncbi:MAG: hypothetical protein JWL82_311 [Parcubacteria group bacterium]|nr:hypothetical protein [Parcubacteria group bacterium]
MSTTEISRRRFYMRLYYACARVQANFFGRKGELPEPRTNCMIFRMYFWGLFCSVGIAAGYLIMLVIALLVMLLVFGVFGSGYDAVFHPHTTRGELGILIWGILILGLTACVVLATAQWAIEKYTPIRFPLEEKRRAQPEGPKFSVLVGDWLKDLDQRKCTPIRIV